MNKKIIKLFTILTLSVTSCSDWLDVKPQTMEPVSSMFDTYQGYKNALTGCYIKMKSRSLWGEYLTFTTVEFLAQHWELPNNSSAAAIIATAIKSHEYDDENVQVRFQNIYRGLYNIIVQANTIIEAMPQTGETAISDPLARGVIEGEAYAIRALCHFEVLRLFGQVPGGSIKVRLPYTEDVSREPVSYYEYEDYVNKIEHDLNRAAELLEKYDPFVTYTNSEINSLSQFDEYLHYRKLRLNYWAVKALQARFYLYVGYKSQAAAAANEVIEAANYDKGFGLYGTMDIVGNKYYALPSEGLFTLSNHQLNDYIPSLLCAPLVPANVNLHMSIARIEELFVEQYGTSSNNRWGVWLYRVASHTTEYVFELLKYDQQDPAALPVLALTSKQIMPMLRLSEMYLIAMETADNLNRINQLYATYQIDRNILPVDFTNMEEVMQMIEKEYRREFFGEGQMFAYYKRHNATSMLWADKAIKETDFIVPLPDTEYDPNFK